MVYFPVVVVGQRNHAKWAFRHAPQYTPHLFTPFCRRDEVVGLTDVVLGFEPSLAVVVLQIVTGA